MATILEQKIVETAKKYLHIREYGGNNKGFNDVTFQNDIKEVGWRPTYAWCSLFTKLIWKEVFSVYCPNLIPAILKYIQAGCMNSWRAFKSSKEFRTGNIPRPGAIGIFQSTKDKALGHAVICTSNLLPGNKFNTIEGNTNMSGSREGDRVAIKTRKVGLNGSLNFIGFVYPDSILDGGDVKRAKFTTIDEKENVIA